MSASPFDHALARLRPVLLAHRFRLDTVDRAVAGGGVSTAEYFRDGLRLRLVYEGKERALWMESARQAGAQVISRWTDIEWVLADGRLPLDTDLGEERLERLTEAVGRFLARPG